MKVVRYIASFLIAAVLLLVFLYFVISLCVSFFILTGRTVVGEPMLFDLHAPSLAKLLVFQLICLAVLSAGYFLHRKLAHTSSRRAA